ncbi:hypothetical protein PYCCODRAFT_122654 [Trametes coccinea BRFM310]|uniref:Uncharacterized protein n=1 Tax=Trametes coccinea (strain BRFM310) TaxID=1353009 RepID=A0A1Y2IU49_TRAC3|nr:hypothetical protein PYCCODRAFT_122654 [Trametes coccinea BRFM310]
MHFRPDTSSSQTKRRKTPTHSALGLLWPDGLEVVSASCGRGSRRRLNICALSARDCLADSREDRAYLRMRNTARSARAGTALVSATHERWRGGGTCTLLDVCRGRVWTLRRSCIPLRCKGSPSDPSCERRRWRMAELHGEELQLESVVETWARWRSAAGPKCFHSAHCPSKCCQ